ncbi:MAG: HNH endonuclease [Jatrophihabitans sp.]
MSVEDEIRAAAMQWLEQVTLAGTIPVSREQLANDFRYHGTRFPLVDRGRGIRKPQGWSAALSIMTAAAAAGRPSPYADVVGPDGLPRYKFRRDEGGQAENQSLRVAMRDQLPLIWLVGLQPGLFQPLFPEYLVAEETQLEQFVLSPTPAGAELATGSPVESELRRYLVAQRRVRLHQATFAATVMRAYRTQCSVCRLGHRELLDAAHITPDIEAGGAPIVTNGIALCKIHHVAYDRNILGIRPDYTIEIHSRLLYEIDGPMLLHGLQEHHGTKLMRLPSRLVERPDPDRLQDRWQRFQAA